MRAAACICVSIVVVSCVPTAPTPTPNQQADDVLTVFLTGNELGELKPCGCSGGQLGGLERRSAIFNAAAASRRLIIGTGSLVKSDSDQNLIKFNVMIEALGLLNYDVVNLNERDAEIARSLGPLDKLSQAFSIISSQGLNANVPAVFTKQFLLDGKTTAVTVAAFDVNSAPIEQVRELFGLAPRPQTINILILNDCRAETIDSIASMGVVDCLVCPSDSDKPEVLGETNKRPLLVSVGRYGKYVGKLQIKARKGTDKPSLTYTAVEVNDTLRDDSNLVDLYKDYQELVKEAGLLDNVSRYPLPEGLGYIGSKSCQPCHKYAYEKWSTKAHAHAYATLEKVGSQYDPECVGCHVAGLEYETGFVSEETTDHLKNVGCENCHGPGSKHAASGGSEETTEPRSECTTCHTPDHSAEYVGNEERYFEKIIHW
jgi:hypothetical protein